jgi:flagellar assembly protein FliH
VTTVLRSAPVASAPRSIGPDGAGLPIASDLRELIDDSVDEAKRAGHREGYEAGYRAASERVAMLTAAVREGTSAATEALRAARSGIADEVLSLALEIAEQVIGREPHDSGRALAERVAQALAEVDDAPLTLTVNPTDADVVRASLPPGVDLTLVADETVTEGEAFVRGPWSNVEITRGAAWFAVRRALDAEE